MATISEAELAAAYGLSPAEFEQVIDTVLGEARGEGFIGMAAVAKAMDNRATVRGQSIYDVVTAKNQFDGAAFQSGKKDAKSREVAIEALAAVAMGEDPAQVGTADHFATPETKTSWTEAFKDTAKTVGGHTFYSSPEALELAQFADVTATPQAKPDMAFQTAQQTINEVAPTSVNAFAPTIDSVTVDPFDAVIAEPQSNRDRAAQVAANAGHSVFGRPDGASYAEKRGGILDSLDPTVASMAAEAARGLSFDPVATSGARSDRFGTHKGGMSLDARTNNLNDAQIAELVQQHSKAGFPNIGIISPDTRGPFAAHMHAGVPNVFGGNRFGGTNKSVWGGRYAEPLTQAALRGHELGIFTNETPAAKPGRAAPVEMAFAPTATAPAAIGRSAVGGIGATPATAYGSSFGATDFAAAPLEATIAPDGYSDFGMALSPSRDLADYASVVDQNVGQGRSTSAGRSYVDVDLNDFAVTNPASDFSVPSIAVDLGNGVFGIERSGPTTAMPADVSVATISPDRGLAPLDAPQSIGSRPDLGWAADLQTSTPSIGTAATAATAPTSNVATPQGNQQQGGGFFGQIGDALGGFFGNPAVQGTLGGMAVGGIPGAVIGGTIGAVAGRGKDKDNDKDKDKDGKGRGFGRSTIGGALRGGAWGGRIAGGPGALAGAVIGGGINAARNGGIGIPGLGNIGAGLGTISDLGSNPSVGHAALGYAMDQARANPNYTGMDFSRDFASRGGQISNGRAEPGKITAAEFNAGQREVGKAKSVAESFSEDASEAFGGCFLTTAAVDVTGEADNGDTLQTLRWFRDNIMRARPDWSADVDEYYRVAPAIVERLNGDKATYERLMDEHIRPAVKAIKAGKYEQAYRVYRAMVDDLQKA